MNPNKNGTFSFSCDPDFFAYKQTITLIIISESEEEEEEEEEQEEDQTDGDDLDEIGVEYLFNPDNAEQDMETDQIPATTARRKAEPQQPQVPQKVSGKIYQEELILA